MYRVIYLKFGLGMLLCFSATVCYECDQIFQLSRPNYSETCLQYDGICGTHLRQLIDNNSTLATLSNKVTSDENILRLFNLTQVFPDLVSEECSTVLVPWLCQYAYPPCDADGNPLLITQEQCINIRDDVCANEWRLVMVTDLASILPDCEGFDKEFDVEVNSSLPNVSKPIRCHNQFTKFCKICVPSCGSFSQYPDHIVVLDSAFEILTGALAISGEIVFIVAAVVRRKQM